MHNKAPPGTHPDDDSVVCLEFGQKLVPTYNLRLVQRTKATKHFYITLRWDVGHCADSERRMLLLRGKMLLRLEAIREADRGLKMRRIFVPFSQEDSEDGGEAARFILTS